MGTVTGQDAIIRLCSGSTTSNLKHHSVWGISDFSLTVSRDTVEQELVGQKGN